MTAMVKALMMTMMEAMMTKTAQRPHCTFADFCKNWRLLRELTFPHRDEEDDDDEGDDDDDDGGDDDRDSNGLTADCRPCWSCSRCGS